jgi:hypothetical protein
MGAKATGQGGLMIVVTIPQDDWSLLGKMALPGSD